MLLKNGAAKVYAVDVGYGQLAWSLRQDGRVAVMERTNARNLTPDMFAESMDMAVMDLSFISVRLIIPAVVPLLKENGDIICLIKPQFEAGKADVGKKGVVRDAAVHERVLREFMDFVPHRRMYPSGAGLLAHPRPRGEHRISRVAEKGRA